MQIGIYLYYLMKLEYLLSNRKFIRGKCCISEELKELSTF